MHKMTIMIVVATALLPAPAFAAGSIASGKNLFAQHCASCHGVGGNGDGAAAAALSPKPTNLTNKATMAKLKDTEIFSAIKKGGVAVGKSPLMPSFGSALKDGEIHDLVAFVTSLSK